MGASTSTEQKVSAEQQEEENVAASTGALPILKKAFSKLGDSETNTVSLENLQVLFINLDKFLIIAYSYSFIYNLIFLTCKQTRL